MRGPRFLHIHAWRVTAVLVKGLWVSTKDRGVWVKLHIWRKGAEMQGVYMSAIIVSPPCRGGRARAMGVVWECGSVLFSLGPDHRLAGLEYQVVLVGAMFCKGQVCVREPDMEKRASYTFTLCTVRLNGRLGLAGRDPFTLSNLARYGVHLHTIHD